MLIAQPFFYLRHGETDWNRERRIQGCTDTALNACGIAQAEAAREALRAIAIATICTSPLARAHATARIVNQALGRPIVVIDELRECSFGPHEGTLAASWFESWRRGTTPEGVEPYQAFLDRALAAVNRALAETGPVLIVGHAGVYWAVQRHGRLDAEQHLPNGVPVRHDPPTPGFPGWRARPIAADGAA